MLSVELAATLNNYLWPATCDRSCLWGRYARRLVYGSLQSRGQHVFLLAPVQRWASCVTMDTKSALVVLLAVSDRVLAAAATGTCHDDRMFTEGQRNAKGEE